MSTPRKIWLETWIREKGDVEFTVEASPYEGSALYHHDDVVRELVAEIERLRMPSIDDGFALAHFHDGWNEALDAVSTALAKIAQEG